MLKEEWRNFLSNKKLLGSIIVILFIPIIYSGIFLGAVWDPYGKTGNLPIAVVNEDEVVTYHEKELGIGKELINHLKENNSFEWHFVNKEKAEKGLKVGDYYMVLTIPKNFSTNASTVLDENPKQMNLTYETNPSRSMTGRLIASQGAKSVTAEIADTVTMEYTEVLFQQLQELGKGLGDAAEGTNQLSEGAEKLQNGNEELTTNLQKLAASTLTFKDGASALAVGVGQFVEGVEQLGDGATKLHTGLEQYTNGAFSLHTGTTAALQGIDQLNEKTPSLLNGINQLVVGLSEATAGGEALETGIASVQNGSEKLSEGLGKLATGSIELQNGLKELNNNLPTEEQIETLTNGLTTIQAGLNQLGEELPSNSNEANAVTVITNQLQNITTVLIKLQESLTTNPEEIVTAVQNTSIFQSELNDTQRAEILGALQGELQQQASVQKETLEILGASMQSLVAEINKLAPAMEQVDALADSVTQLNVGVNQVVPKAITALQGYQQIHNNLDTKIIPGAGQLSAGLGEAVTSSNALTEGVKKLKDGADNLNDGINQLASGGKVLQNGAAAYTNGVSQLSTGMEALEAGASQLTNSSGELLTGFASLMEGAGKLTANTASLQNGMDQLAGGSLKLNDGALKLADGSTEIGKGIESLQNGASTLESKLQVGAEQVQDTNVTTDNYKMIADPIKLTESEVSTVHHYGQALASYIVPLGLFVGAIAFNLIFPITVPSYFPTSAGEWWLSKFTILCVQGVLNSFILVGMLLGVLKLPVDNIGYFMVTSIITSIAFMCLVALLTIGLGNAGRFIAMILLVLQIASCGGMFPLELSNSFYQIVHIFLPMSYAVTAFRESISSGIGGREFIYCILFLCLFTVFFNLLMYLVLKKQTVKYDIQNEISV